MKKVIEDISDNMDTIKVEILKNRSSIVERIINSSLAEATI